VEDSLSAEHITPMKERQFLLPAWAISVTLHGAVVGLAFAFAVQVKPILPEDVFKWDVALIDGTKPEPKAEQVKSVVAQEPSSTKKVFPSHIKRVSEPSKVVAPAEQLIEPLQPTVETVQPIEQKVEIPQAQEEPVAQRVVEADGPKPESIVETKAPEPVAVAASPELVESSPIQREPVASASVSSPEVQETSAPAPSLDSSMNTVSTPGYETKADNRWLAESLWRRVAELKRYPTVARMNGQEGKVIVKAVIRSDGQLADVMIQKSSGHSALDAAALEVVKLACPIHMKQALGKPQIVVTLPIVYRLSS